MANLGTRSTTSYARPGKLRATNAARKVTSTKPTGERRTNRLTVLRTNTHHQRSHVTVVSADSILIALLTLAILCK